MTLASAPALRVHSTTSLPPDLVRPDLSVAGAPEPQDHAVWHQAVQAAVLFAIDPAAAGGVRLRAPAGPVRDLWLSLLRALLGGANQRRMPFSITDERLLGGLDLPATLASGQPVLQQGLLVEVDGSVLLLATAERLPPGTAACLANVMGNGQVRLERDGLTWQSPTRFGVVALDEGIGNDEALVATLRDRLAFDHDLSQVPPRCALADELAQQWMHRAADIEAARERIASIAVPDEIVGAVRHRADFGRGLGACVLAGATLDGNEAVTEDDATIAARQVLAPRACRRQGLSLNPRLTLSPKPNHRHLPSRKTRRRPSRPHCRTIAAANPLACTCQAQFVGAARWRRHASGRCN